MASIFEAFVAFCWSGMAYFLLSSLTGSEWSTGFRIGAGVCAVLAIAMLALAWWFRQPSD